ncbi:MAG: 16S rRNA (guanine(527)-N(7))-methyltransferase RsmG [Armatimonadetes bacterium]|nr:16S rRNA (guanine(527)-N(7))-methyltransferase RsmG [Armatimonadota bacterium]
MNNPTVNTKTWDEREFTSALQAALKKLALKLSAEQETRMGAFARLLFETNQRLNLTRITDPQEVAVKHFADSLTVLSVGVEERAGAVDVGSGGGLPGIPLAIARPDLRVTMLEATGRKAAFLSEAVASLGLDNAEVLCGRVEELAHERQIRQRFDIAVWRGLGDLALGAEVCVPLVRTGGRAVAMKGPKLEEELAAARALIGQLGGRVEKIVEAALPGDIRHRLLVIEKIRQTPPQFPRAWKRIKNSQTHAASERE